MENNVIFWLNDDDLLSVPTSAFWNDENKEAEKAYDISDGNSEKLLRYLRNSTTYYEECVAVLRFAEDLGCKVQGRGVDVAAGVCWTTALLSKIEGVDTIYAMDISKHRLLKLAPLVLKAFEAEQAKIIRAVGSFYDIRLPDASVDFCMMSQAFHHADNPWRLLNEVARVLKPGSPALVIGETPIFPAELLKKRIKNVIRMMVPTSLYVSKPVYHWWPPFQDLFPPDLEGGDHYYRIGDYPKIFDECGFNLYEQRRRRYVVFVAVKRG